MPIAPTRVQVIMQIPFMKKLLAELKGKFPSTTPNDRICAYYDPHYRIWHVSCTNYWLYKTAKYVLWCRVMHKKYTKVPFVFVNRYIVSSTMEERQAKEDRNYFFLK